MVAVEECVALEIAPGPQVNLISWLPVKSLQNPLIDGFFFVRLKMQCQNAAKQMASSHVGRFNSRPL